MSEIADSPPSILLIDENLQDRSLTSFMVLSAVPDVGLKEISEESEFLSAIRVSSYALVITESKASWAPFGPLLAEIRRHQPRAQVVVFTSDESPEILETAEREGAADCVAKTSQGFLSLVGIAKEALQAAPRDDRPYLEPETPAEVEASIEDDAGLEAPIEEDAEIEVPTGEDAEVEVPIEVAGERVTPSAEDQPATEVEDPILGYVEPPAEPKMDSAPSSGLPKWVRWSLLALAVVVVASLLIVVGGDDDGGPQPEPRVQQSEPAGGVATEPTTAASESVTSDTGEPDLIPENKPRDEAAVTPEAPLTLVLRAKDRVWLAVSVDGRQVLDATLEAGEERSFAGQESASLRVGNAAGLSVSWNGQDLGSIGRARQVRQLGFSTSDYWFGRRRPSSGN